MSEFYDFRTGWKIEEKDLELYILNEWLWRSQERRRLKTSPFAYNDLVD